MYVKDLSHVLCDEIETKLMIILCSSPNIVMNEFNLFNKLLDQYDYSDSGLYNISSTFKAKYKLVLRNLNKNCDNVVIFKEFQYFEIVFKQNISDKIIKEDSSSNKVDTIGSTNEVCNYILNNSILDELKYQDPSNGNTIFHDLVISESTELIKNLIDKKQMNWTILNNDGKSPLDLISNLPISSLLLNNLYIKILKLEENIISQNNEIASLQKIHYHDNRNNIDDIINNISFYKILKIKIYNNYHYLIGLLLLLSILIKIDVSALFF